MPWYGGFVLIAIGLIMRLAGGKNAPTPRSSARAFVPHTENHAAWVWLRLGGLILMAIGLYIVLIKPIITGIASLF